MKPGALRVLALLCIAAGCLSEAASGRTWIDKHQAKRFEAELIRVVDGKAVLMRSGRPVIIPLTDFVDKDLEYIRREMESRGKPWLAAPPEAFKPWTDIQGRKVNALFIRMADEDVLFGNAKGTFKVPFELLSSDDQDFIRRELTAQGKANLIPDQSSHAATAKRPAEKDKDDDATEKPGSREIVGGVLGGKAFDADLANDADRRKPVAAATDQKSPEPVPDREIASVIPAKPRAEQPAMQQPAAEKPAEKPATDQKTPAETAPAAKPAPAEKRDELAVAADAMASVVAPASSSTPAASAPAASTPAAAKPAAAPAAGFVYCSRCKRAKAGFKIGDVCPGCSEPFDMFQNADGSLTIPESLSFWGQYGTTIICGALALCGFIGFQTIKSRRG